MAAVSQSATITAQNTFTTAQKFVGPFNIGIWGTFVGTVTVQKSYDSGGTWIDLYSYTAPASEVGLEPENLSTILWRIGIKTGGYSSGTANVRLGGNSA